MKKGDITVRPAVLEDIDGIMSVEERTFGFDFTAMATREIMISRVKLLNTPPSPNWFWVAERQGSIVGDIVLQPMRIRPHECVSWSASTDNGTLERTLDLDGKNLFVVSLAALENAPPGIADLLAHQAFTLWATKGIEYLMFCSRMPGFHASGMSPEAYWCAARPDQSPKDWMLHEYADMLGTPPARLLLNGYPPDIESGGHGVLFAASDSAMALSRSAARVYRAGIVHGARQKEE